MAMPSPLILSQGGQGVHVTQSFGWTASPAMSSSETLLLLDPMAVLPSAQCREHTLNICMTYAITVQYLPLSTTTPPIATLLQSALNLLNGLV